MHVMEKEYLKRDPKCSKYFAKYIVRDSEILNPDPEIEETRVQAPM